MTANVAMATEPELIERAQRAVSHCNWDVGECAALWTKRFARGRTDADFAQLVGLSPDQVYQRRRVWETFGDVREHYQQLKWSHFYSALTWDDAAECLQWAQDTEATVAEMRAWRRAQRGEDLTQAGDDDYLGWLPMEPSEVRAPRDNEGSRSELNDESRPGRERDPNASPLALGVARESGNPGDDYAPFRPDAVIPPQSNVSSRPKPELSLEQIVRRLATTLERCTATISPEFLGGMDSVPAKDRQRLQRAAEQLVDRLHELSTLE